MPRAFTAELRSESICWAVKYAHEIMMRRKISEGVHKSRGWGLQGS